VAERGTPQSRQPAGGAIGLGLWLLLQGIPGLNGLQQLRLLRELIPWVLLAEWMGAWARTRR
jgi:hypothetical protein